MKLLDRAETSPSEGRIAGLIPTLKQMTIDGIACHKAIQVAERSLSVTSRQVLGHWFDQAARLAMARSVHGLKGTAFREFAAEIGIKGSRAFDVERLDGHRESVFAQYEKEAAEPGYRWPSWKAVLADIMPSKTFLMPYKPGRSPPIRHETDEPQPVIDETPRYWTHGSDEWGTPPNIFNFFDRHYHFDIDVAATKQNTKCKSYWTKEDDGLKQTWGKGKTYWLNPPYSKTSDWTKKANDSAKQGAIIVALLPNRSATKWYSENIASTGAIIQLTGRVSFLNAQGEAMQGDAPFNSIIVIWPASAAKRIMRYCQPITAAILKL